MYFPFDPRIFITEFEYSFFFRDINETYHISVLQWLEIWETFTYTTMPGDTDELAWLQNGVYMFKGMFTRALVVSIQLRQRLMLNFKHD